MRYLFFLLFFILYPTRVFALEFSEIAYDIVGSDDGHEWLELHNETDQPVDLTGYYFADSSAHILIPPPGKDGQGSLVLSPGGYLILADDATLFLADHPGFTGSVIDTTMSLSNYSSTRTAPIVIQILNKDKNPLSEATFMPSVRGERGFTLELDPTLVWVESDRPGGSPGMVRPPPQPPPPLPAVHLSEVVSNPQGADSGAETVELYNAGSQTVHLEGWYITDKLTAAGNSNRQTISSTPKLEPSAFTAIVLKGSFLNNKDETVSLYSADDRLVETLALPGDAPEGQSYALIDGRWQWTAQLTLGSANLLAQPATTTSSSKAPPSQDVKVTASSLSPALTKRNSVASPSLVASPVTGSKAVSGQGANSSPQSLPTRLEHVAGITTTESPSVLVGYLVTFLPPLFMIGALAFYLYKKKLLFNKPRPP